MVTFCLNVKTDSYKAKNLNKVAFKIQKSATDKYISIYSNEILSQFFSKLFQDICSFLLESPVVVQVQVDILVQFDRNSKENVDGVGMMIKVGNTFHMCFVVHVIVDDLIEENEGIKMVEHIEVRTDGIIYYSQQTYHLDMSDAQLLPLLIDHNQDFKIKWTENQQMTLINNFKNVNLLQQQLLNKLSFSIYFLSSQPHLIYLQFELPI